MWDFSILLSIRLMLRTLPFLVLKAAVYLIFTVILLTSIFGGIHLAGYFARLQMAPDARLPLVLGALVGLGVAILVIRWCRVWSLYLVKAAHIAVLVELTQGRRLPGDRWQIGYGQSIVKERFGEASVLFLLDEAVRGVLRAIDRLTFGFLAFLPQKLAAQIAFTIRSFLYFTFAYIDEIILAHAINNRSTDPWGSAREALALYGQNWATILKNALWLTLFTVGPVSLVFWAAVWPAWIAYQAAHTPDTLTALVTAFLTTSALSAALMGPFALNCLLQVWFRAISEDRVSPSWSAEVSRIAPELNQYHAPRMAMPRRDGTTRNGDLV